MIHVAPTVDVSHAEPGLAEALARVLDAKNNGSADRLLARFNRYNAMRFARAAACRGAEHAPIPAEASSPRTARPAQTPLRPAILRPTLLCLTKER